MQITERLCAVPADLTQQADKVLGQPLNRAGFEPFISVVKRQFQAALMVFFAVQLQVELGFAAVPVQLFGQQARQAAQGAEVALLVVWFAVSAALRPLERLRSAVEEREMDDLRPLPLESVQRELRPLYRPSIILPSACAGSCW